MDPSGAPNSNQKRNYFYLSGTNHKCTKKGRGQLHKTNYSKVFQFSNSGEEVFNLRQEC